MTTINLSLWQAVEKTPLLHVKEITGKSYKGTSPNPHYLVHKATEIFGPCGIGWGFTIEDERIEEGAGGTKMHIARVKVWYEWNGKRGEVEHIGGTEFSGVRSSGKEFTDEDAPKKSVTDALVKALSMIGFAGDIFMGRYDDSKYISELREDAKAEKTAEAKPAPAPKNEEARKTFAALQSDMRQCKTKDDLGRWWRDEECKALRATLPADWQANLKTQLVELGEDMAKKRGTVEAIQEQFPGSTVTDERITDVSGRELELMEG